MSLDVKICGLSDAQSVAAVVDAGARYAGFLFCPEARRRVNAETAASLMKGLPASIITVGLFVNPSNEEITHVLFAAPLQMIQLHGEETPERVHAVRTLTGLPVMKAIGIADMRDIENARRYETTADMLLFDAKSPAGGNRGGNGIAFNWNLLAHESFAKPWMLAGGLNETNLADAVRATGARIVDVSSGVEDGPGCKNPAKIASFIAAAKRIE